MSFLTDSELKARAAKWLEDEGFDVDRELVVDDVAGVADVGEEQSDQDDPYDVVVEKIANAVHLLFSSESDFLS